MNATPANFWTRIETHFPLAGPRRHLQEELGTDVVAAFERSGVLRQTRMASRYPCQLRRGDGCPRAIIEIDGTYAAVCGNRPAECPDIALSEKDAGFLAMEPANLCRAIASALMIRPAPEALSSLADVHRIGTFVPDPGIGYAVFLAVRADRRGYAEALDALRSRQVGGDYAVLVPTERFLPDDAVQRLADRGVPVLVLSGAVGLADGRLTSAVDPIRYFGGIGGGSSAGPQAGQIVARAMVRAAGKPPGWLDLNQRQLDDLRGAASQYDVFADEANRTVAKKAGGTQSAVPLSYFRSIWAALTKRGYFDPTIDGPDMVSGKQTFQRARATFDIRSNRSSWTIFQSVRTDEGHSVYSFAPDKDVSFAFVFLPEG